MASVIKTPLALSKLLITEWENSFAKTQRPKPYEIILAEALIEAHGELEHKKSLKQFYQDAAKNNGSCFFKLQTQLKKAEDVIRFYADQICCENNSWDDDDLMVDNGHVCKYHSGERAREYFKAKEKK